MKKVSASVVDESSGFQLCEVHELVEQMPSFMLAMNKSKNFPNLAVLNDLFSLEVFDDGMSGGIWWKKFTINQRQLNDLKTRIEQDYGMTFLNNDELDTSSTYNEWFARSID